jgi:hypothetical protein
MLSSALRFSLLVVFIFSLLPMEAAPGQSKPSPAKDKSDPKALAFIKEAESGIYNPVREGLKTLSFSIPINTPMGTLGTEHYWFQAPDKFKYKLDSGDEGSDTPGMTDALGGNFETKAKEAAVRLGMYLGNFLTLHLDHFVVTFIGKDKTKVRIRCKAKPDTPEAELLHSKDLIFDEEGMIHTIKMVDVRGRTQTWKLSFKELEGTRLHLLDKIEMESESPEGKTRVVQTYTYTEVEGYHLALRCEILLTDSNTKVACDTQNLKVNEPIDPSVFSEEKSEEKSKE